MGLVAAAVLWGKAMPKFSDIIGQDQIKAYLMKAVEDKKISHAFIINGEKYSGKEFIAGVLAQALNCEEEGTEPCGNCHSCIQAKAHSHPDIIRITHEKPGSVGIGDIREKLIGDIQIKPYQGPYKVYIINEAEKLTVQAQNALLKTLEEPPEYAIILLLTTTTGVFLPTILSRCVVLDMKPVKDELIENYLVNTLQVPEEKLRICIAFAAGNLGKARMLAQSDDFENIRQAVVYLLKNIRNMSREALADAVKRSSEYKLDISDYLDIMSIWFRDILLFKATNDINSLIFKDEVKAIKDAAKLWDYSAIEDIISGVEKAKDRLNANVGFDLAMELLFLTIKDAG